MRYIDADALIEDANDLWADKANLYRSLTNEAYQMLARQELRGHAEVVQLINKQPTADVSPVVHGRWDEDHKCTHCGADAVHHDIDDETVVYYPTRYCPHCGARMYGEAQDEL